MADFASAAASQPRRGFGRTGFALAAMLAVVGVAWLWRAHFDPQATLAWLAAQRAWVAAHEVEAGLGYFVAYVAFAALSLPGAWIMSVAGGALFGPWAGPPLVSLSSTAGATLAMLASRYLLRDAVAARFPQIVTRIDRGVAAQGARWLFAARLTPVIPFFALNLAAGLTTLRATTFALVTLVGAAPFATLYALAGARLATVAKPSDVISPGLVAVFALVGFAPLAVGRIGRWRAGAAQLKAFTKPRRFDYNLIVIGAGSAGLVAAYVAAAAKARVALIERGEMGGDCLNTGCVPSKALLRAAKIAHESRTAASFGFSGALTPDFAAVMARVRATIAKVAPHDSAERYRGLGVEVIAGEARIVDPWTVEVGGRKLTARRLVVATGAEPALPPIPGLAEIEPLTSETVWGLTQLPARLLVLGGGAIGCELAQAFARLGAKVSLVEAAPRLLAREDDEVSHAMAEALQEDGVEIFMGAAAAIFSPGLARLADGREIAFDRALVAVGRKPRVRGFGLEELGLLENGRLVVDDSLRTKLPTILAAGDVIGDLQFTHAAGQYGARATINALLAPFAPARAALRPFPAVVWTDPEIARVGLNETEARAKGIAYEVTRYDLAELDRAIADGADRGFLTALTVPGRDRLLGVTIVGARAGDMLAEFTLAMHAGLGLKTILAAIHPYPGWSDAARALAGEWRRAHTSARAVGVAGHVFAWMRG